MLPVDCYGNIVASPGRPGGPVALTGAGVRRPRTSGGPLARSVRPRRRSGRHVGGLALHCAPMRAMVLAGQAPVTAAPLVLSNVPEPEPGPGEIRVRVGACGLCRTDLHVIEGDLPPRRQPLIPGHQVVGVVDRSGPGAG